MNGSPGHLPGAIDPIKLAERGSRLTGTLSLGGMTRLTESCLDKRGEVDVDLEFGRREQDNRRAMTGRLVTRLSMTCSRCLEPVEVMVEASPEVTLLRPDETGSEESDEADSMIVETPIELRQLVEDELLLALPMFPAHPEGQCPTGASRAAKGQTKRMNPFAALAALKGGSGKPKR